MAKLTKSVRMSAATIEKLSQLAKILKESEAEVIERAIDRLFDNRQAVYEEDQKQRRDLLKG